MTIHGADHLMMASVYYIAGESSATGNSENFEGRLQGLVINGDRILDEAHLKQIDYEGKSLFYC